MLSNRVLHVIFFDYIFLLFAAALIRLQRKIALLFVMEAAFDPRCHSSGSDLDVGLSETVKGRGMFVFSSFATFHFS